MTTGGQPRVVALWPVLRDVFQHEAIQNPSHSGPTLLLGGGDGGNSWKEIKPPNTAYYSNVPFGDFDRRFPSLNPLLMTDQHHEIVYQWSARSVSAVII